MNEVSLRVIADVAKAVNAAQQVDEVLEELVRAVCRGPRWMTASVMAVDEECNASVLLARHDPLDRGDAEAKRQWELRTSPVLKVSRSMEMLVLPDAQAAHDYPAFKVDALARGYRTAILVPLSNTDHQGRRVVMSLQSREVVTIDTAERAFLATVATVADLALEKARTLRDALSANKLLQDSISFRDSLFEAALRGQDKLTSLGRIEAYINQPWFLFDAASGRVLTSKSLESFGPSQRRWSELFETDLHGALQRVAAQTRGSNEAVRSELVVRVDDSELTLPLTAVSIEVEHRLAGVFFIVSQGHEGAPLSDELLRDIRYAIGVGLMRDFLIWRTSAASRAELLSRLVHGEWLDLDLFTRQLAGIGVDLAGQNRLLILSLEGMSSDPDFVEAKAEAILQRLKVKSATGLVDNTLILVLPNAGDEAGSVSLAERILREAAVFFDRKPLAALSAVCTTIGDYRSAFVTASRLLALMISTGLSGLMQPVTIGADALLLASAADAETRRIVKAFVGPLDGRDRKDRETLLAFVENEGRLADTASTLAIHVSTLRYRLERLREHYGFSLDSPEERFKIRIALHLQSLATRVVSPG